MRSPVTVFALAGLIPAVVLAQAPATRAPAPSRAAATPAPPAPPPPLVEIRNLTVRSLRSVMFRLDSAQAVHIEAIGGQPQGRSAAQRFFEHGIFQRKEDRTWDKTVWPGNAWIVEARTRRVAWELSRATNITEADDGIVTFRGMVKLPAGIYEVHYAALFPVTRVWDQDNDWRVRTEHPVHAEQLRGPYLDDGGIKEFRIAIWAKGQQVPGQAAVEEAGSLGAFVLEAQPGGPRRAAFEVTRRVTVELYGVGEKNDRDWQDYGMIREIPGRRTVWSFREQPARGAGGAAKNREVRDTMTLAPGKYLATYVADDSHHPGDWTETPPWDASAWGLSVRVMDPKDRSAIKAFEYTPVLGAPIVAFTNLGNEEFRSQRFVVTRAFDAHLFALGEGAGRFLADRAWLVDSTGRALWRIEGDNSQPAGGSSKNRLFDGIVRLEPGRYTLYAITDDSHSARAGWNGEPPFDGEYWGVTLATGDAALKPATVATLDSAQPTALVRLQQVGSDAHEQGRFTLAADGPVRISAMGEGTSGDGREMSDYGWVEDSTGRRVWEMKYEDTEPAGGSAKNRREDAVVRLKAGAYTVHFRTDASHAFRDWNTYMPDDPMAWGIVVTRVR